MTIGVICMDDEEKAGRTTFGDIAVPASAYWGAQTQRSLENFAIGGQRMPIAVIHALARVKRAAAQVNATKGLIQPDICSAPSSLPPSEVIAGKLDADHFPLESSGRRDRARSPT